MRVGGILWGGGQPAGLAAAKTSLFIQKVFDCKWYKPPSLPHANIRRSLIPIPGKGFLNVGG